MFLPEFFTIVLVATPDFSFELFNMLSLLAEFFVIFLTKSQYFSVKID